MQRALSILAAVLIPVAITHGQDVYQDGNFDSGGSRLAVHGAKVNVGGHWEAPIWRINDGAKIYVKPSCSVNNNGPEKMYASYSEVTGTGHDRDTLEFDVNFSSDHMGYDSAWGFRDSDSPEFYNWARDGQANGWSIVWYSDLTVVTNHTRNLQSISKIGYSGVYSHHGLIMFGSYQVGSRPCTWIVQTNDQYYDAGISWGTDVHLVLKKNLTYDFAGGDDHYVHDARIHFGPDIMAVEQNNGPVTLTVSGPGSLILDGPPGHFEGSRMVLTDGGNLVVNIDQNADNIEYMNADSDPFLRPVRTCADGGGGDPLPQQRRHHHHRRRE
jgi:hypothetical protein